MSLIHRRPVGPVRLRRGWVGLRPSRWLGTALMVALLALVGLVALPRLLGYEVLTVQSGSMGETAPTGAMVVARTLPAEQVRVGDIVLVRESIDGEVAGPGVLHRVIRHSMHGGEVVVRTQGDANPEPDPTPYVLSADTVTPSLVVPYAGRALTFARTPLGWSTAIALPATVLLWLQLKAIWFPPRRPGHVPT